MLHRESMFATCVDPVEGAGKDVFLPAIGQATRHWRTISSGGVCVIETSGRALLSLIDDILDLSRIETRKITLEHVDFDLRRHLPIVALTANAMTGDREHCIGAGMSEYRSKPVEMRLLAEVFARWLPPLAADAAPQTAIPASNSLCLGP